MFHFMDFESQPREISQMNASKPSKGNISNFSLFHLIMYYLSPTCTYLQEVPLEVGESKLMTIQFDPAYQNDSHSRIAEKLLTVTYLEHPHTVSRVSQ